jgi:hypothetical protein
VAGRALPAAGSCRFGRPLDASILTLGLENGPERHVCLGWNERKFLSLIAIGVGMGVALGAAIGMTFGMMKKD